MSAAPRIASTLQRAWLQRGPLAMLLWPLSQGYAVVVALRRLLYRLDWLPAETLPVPVVVVGNLIAGGAGKTPTVLAVVERLQRQGHRPGVVSRGHGRRGAEVIEVERSGAAADVGDEPLLLKRRGGVPVVVGADRVEAARTLLRRHPDVSVIVADDGLQHLRLARDAQVIVFDERGIGNGWLLPAGPLREPMPPQVPTRSVVLYNAPRASTSWAGSLAVRRLSGVAALADWHAGAAPDAAALEALRGRPLIAAAGIAQPQRFFAMLRERGLRFDELPLPDHADFDAMPWPESAADVIVTEKDAVKLDAGRIGATRVWVATLDFEPDAAFDAALARIVPPPADGNPPA